MLGAVLWPLLTSRVAARRIRGEQGLILTFHYVGTPILKGLSEDLFLPPHEFARILDFVTSELFPLEPIEFLERLQCGNLPAKATLLTFDDCTREAVTDVLPELEQRGLKACFFACPGLIEDRRTIPSLELMNLCVHAPRGRYSQGNSRGSMIEISDSDSRRNAFRELWPLVLQAKSEDHACLLASFRRSFCLDTIQTVHYPLATWHELAQLVRAGMLVGNHTMLHSTASADGISRFRLDVEKAYKALEEKLPRQRRVFSYPYGRPADALDETTRCLQDTDTEYAFVTQGGAARPKRSGLLRLHREDASYCLGAAKLAPLLALTR
jgi:peptidoglycan/xylan/chitin deacetylase (PgdA/CDA1 family)